MSTYSTSAQVTGDSDRALQAVVTTFSGLGFRIDRYTGRTVVMHGPGGFTSTSQNPALGASRVTVSQQGRRLELEAELGGADGLLAFIRWFPLALGGGLCLVFTVVFGLAFSGGEARSAVLIAAASTALAVSPWLVISPWMRRSVLARTRQALETILVNACASGLV
jgi:hypothetical protein